MSEYFDPVHARVLVKRQKAEKVGSILLPDEAQKRYAALRCTVVRISNTCELAQLGKLEPGDDVLIGRYSGDWVNMEGKVITPTEEAELFVVSEDDIIGIFRKEEDAGKLRVIHGD